MKKMMFLMLTLMVLSAASMNAQVTIGSDQEPDESAVLDLQSTDKGLLIPRVALTAVNSATPLTSKVAGMVVYNTGTGGVADKGVYYNDGTNWIKIGSGELNVLTEVNVGENGLTKSTNGTTTTLALPVGTTSGQVLKYDGTKWEADADAGLTSEGDGIIGNEVTNATTNGGLVRAGMGTVVAPYTLGIAAKGVTSGMIGDAAVSGDKIARMSAIPGQVLSWNGSVWAPGIPLATLYFEVYNQTIPANLYVTIDAVGANANFFCFVRSSAGLRAVAGNNTMRLFNDTPADFTASVLGVQCINWR
jgi:hypothetical protein